MSYPRYLGDPWHPSSTTPFCTVRNRPPLLSTLLAASPQRECYCDAPVEEPTLVEEPTEMFKVKIYLSEYQPDEIKIKSVTVRNVEYLVIEGKKKEENGIVPKELVHRLPMLQGIKLKDFVKKVYPSGILTVSAVKKISAEAMREAAGPIYSRACKLQLVNLTILNY